MDSFRFKPTQKSLGLSHLLSQRKNSVWSWRLDTFIMGKEILWWRFHPHAQISYIKGHCWGRANRIPGRVHKAFCTLCMQRSRVSGSATPFVLWARLCWGNIMPAIAIKCSICLKTISFRGVIHCSTWEPRVAEDKNLSHLFCFQPSSSTLKDQTWADSLVDDTGLWSKHISSLQG